MKSVCKSHSQTGENNTRKHTPDSRAIVLTLSANFSQPPLSLPATVPAIRRHTVQPCGPPRAAAPVRGTARAHIQLWINSVAPSMQINSTSPRAPCRRTGAAAGAHTERETRIDRHRHVVALKTPAHQRQHQLSETVVAPS